MKPALEEARRTLASVKKRRHGDSDIATRTELSYARQTLSTVREILFGQVMGIISRTMSLKYNKNILGRRGFSQHE